MPADRTRPALLLVALLAGCNDTRDLAPATPDTPWRTSTSGAVPGRFDLPVEPALPWRDPHPAIEPAHAYTLDELIDLAQRSNKETRVAWDLARQAAIGVGISRAAWLPSLTLSALGGYQRQALPFPKTLRPNGYITSDAEAVFPALTIRYLLLDFGAREAATETAQQVSIAANTGFTAAHQKVILDVSRAYFGLQAANAALSSVERALGNAQLLLDAAQSRFAAGVGTVVDRDLAQRGVAQAWFQIAQDAATRDSARYALLQAMGLPPDAPLRVAELGDRPLPAHLDAKVDDLMRQALASRPDLQADLARLRASEAGVALARASLLPTIAISARGSGNIGRLATDGVQPVSIAQPEAGVFLDLQWPLYAGGLHANQVRLARARAAQAEDTLELDEDNAMREVAVADDTLSTGLVQYDAALALRTAARTAFASASDAYRHGVGSLTDASTAQRALDDADAQLAATQASVLTSAAALAFATGALTQAK